MTALARRRAALGLAPDPAQDAAAAALERLHAALSGYRPPTGRGLHRLLRRGQAARAPRGLYLYGPVGRGKTMLMDLFFAGAPVARKRRAHFSAFMAEVHERLHRLRRQGDGGTALPRLARVLAEEAWLLCLDELQVDNIGDAMLLHRLFEAILAAGTVVVATSNAAPGELYAGGLQRDRFLPFIRLIEARLEVVCLDGGRDYRRARLAPAQVYHWPLGPAAEAALARAFALVTGGAPPQAEALPVNGRTLRVPRSVNGAAWFTFDELCGAPLGTADYLVLVARYHTLALSAIPVLGPDRREEARRFALLIDLLYENGTTFICSAAAPPDRLFDLPRDGAIAARAASRVIEMQGAGYLARRSRAECRGSMSNITCS